MIGPSAAVASLAEIKSRCLNTVLKDDSSGAYLAAQAPETVKSVKAGMGAEDRICQTYQSNGGQSQN